jgi:hypothetical protein
MSIDEGPQKVQVDEAKARIADAFKKSMENSLAAEGVHHGIVRAGFDRVDHVVEQVEEEKEATGPKAEAGILSGWGLEDEERFQAFAERLRQLKGSDELS